MTVRKKRCANPNCGKWFTRRPKQSTQSWAHQRYDDPGCYIESRPGKRPESTKHLPVGEQVSARYVLDELITALAADWRNEAACRDVDGEVFFALSNDWKGTVDQSKADEAKAVCARCPVQEPCLLAALAERDRYAIRGGLTPAERQGMHELVTA